MRNSVGADHSIGRMVHFSALIPDWAPHGKLPTNSRRPPVYQPKGANERAPSTFGSKEVAHELADKSRHDAFHWASPPGYPKWLLTIREEPGSDRNHIGRD